MVGVGWVVLIDDWLARGGPGGAVLAFLAGGLLLLPVAYSPLQIYVPIFLQRLHGFDPLSAGYAVAGASLGWTAATLATAGAQRRWPNRLILAGPVVMGIGLAAVACLTRSHSPWTPRHWSGWARRYDAKASRSKSTIRNIRVIG